jgi:hypothetical protein
MSDEYPQATPAQKLNIAQYFIASSPVGEVDEVLTGTTTQKETGRLPLLLLMRCDLESGADRPLERTRLWIMESEVMEATPRRDTLLFSFH